MEVKGEERSGILNDPEKIAMVGSRYAGGNVRKVIFEGKNYALALVENDLSSVLGKGFGMTKEQRKNAIQYLQIERKVDSMDYNRRSLNRECFPDTGRASSQRNSYKPR